MFISIVFAGGRGTRLNPLTETIPKPLIRVCGKPLIQWNMERVARNVDKFLIVISYLGEQIIDYFGLCCQTYSIGTPLNELPK